MGPWDTVDDVMASLKEDSRPNAPKLPEVSEQDRRQGRQLAVIHRHHLQDIVVARRLLDQIEAGEALPSALAEAVPNMQMAENYRAFGNLCGRECMILNSHHNIEEQHTFVILEQAGHEGIGKVVAKLREEHKIVHALIEALYGAAVNLVEQPSDGHFAEARRVFDQLEAVVRSHFKYEETELEEALGVFDAL